MGNATMKVDPDELWTDYLLRRLESENLGYYRFEKGKYRETDEARVELDIDVIEGSEVEVVIYRQLVEINSVQDKLGDMDIEGVQDSIVGVKKYSDITALELEYGLEWREDVTIFGDTGDVAVMFFFKENGDVNVVPQSPSLVFSLLPQYMDPKVCKSENVINDIIGFIRKGREIQRYFEEDED